MRRVGNNGVNRRCVVLLLVERVAEAGHLHSPEEVERRGGGFVPMSALLYFPSTLFTCKPSRVAACVHKGFKSMCRCPPRPSLAVKDLAADESVENVQTTRKLSH